MCCAFNFDRAEDMFVKSRYTKLVSQLQTEDRQGSFENR